MSGSPPDRPGRPDRLGPRALEQLVQRIGCIAGAEWVASTDSTQRFAKRFAAPRGPGLGEAYLVVADEQTAGTGRRGSAWHSPRGAGLWLSLLLCSARPRAEWPALTALIALAARDGVHRWAPGRVGLKWPNDLVVRDRKLAGVLAEALPAASGTTPGGCIVLGLGINVTQPPEAFPPELRGRAISVAELAGGAVDRLALLDAVLDSLAARWAAFERGGPRTLAHALREASVLLGRRVVVGRAAGGGPARAGRVVGLGPIGELQVRDEEGRLHTIASGHVLRVDPPLEEPAGEDPPPRDRSPRDRSPEEG